MGQDHTPLLTEENWPFWSARMKGTLMTKKLGHTIAAEPAKPVEQEDDDQARGLIMIGCGAKFICYAERAGTAREAWEALAQVQQGLVEQRRIRLTHALTTRVQAKGETLHELGSYFMQLGDDLDSLDAGVEEHQLTLHFLKALKSQVTQQHARNHDRSNIAEEEAADHPGSHRGAVNDGRDQPAAGGGRFCGTGLRGQGQQWWKGQREGREQQQ